MDVGRSLGLFVVAALAEIGGAWLVWQGVTEHRGLIWIGAGVAALGLYHRGLHLRRPRRPHRGGWRLEDSLSRLRQLGLAAIA